MTDILEILFFLLLNSSAAEPSPFEKQVEAMARATQSAQPEALEKEIQDALTLQDVRTRNEQLMHLATVIVVLGDTNPDEAQQLILLLPARGNDIPRQRATEFVFRRWVRRSGSIAADAALQFWKKGHGHPVGNLLVEWAQRQPRQAMEWVQKLDDRDRTALTANEQLLFALAAYHTSLVPEFAKNVDDRFYSTILAAHSQYFSAKRPASEIVHAVHQFETLKTRFGTPANMCLPSLMRSWGLVEPKTARAFIEKHTGVSELFRYDAFFSLATTWATIDNQAGADLALHATLEKIQNKIFDDRNRHGPHSDPLEEIVTNWSRANRQQATRWVKQIKHEPTRLHLAQVLGLKLNKSQEGDNALPQAKDGVVLEMMPPNGINSDVVKNLRQCERSKCPPAPAYPTGTCADGVHEFGRGPCVETKNGCAWIHLECPKTTEVKHEK